MNKFKELFFLNLTSEAKHSIKQRQYANLHSTYHEKCQRLFNAIECDSYIQPHRHSLDHKIETLLAVKGLFALIQFSDMGAIKAVSFLVLSRTSLKMPTCMALKFCQMSGIH